MTDRHHFYSDPFFDLSADMLATCSTVDWHWKRVNPAFCRTLGFSEEELLATPFLEVIHPDDRERTQQAASELLNGKPRVSVEHRMLCKDGSTRWVAWHTMFYSAEQLMYCVGRDTSERRSMEEALRESEQRFRVLVENASQAVWETDAGGRVVSDSPTWRAYTGQRLEEWLGYGWVNVVHPDDRDFVLRRWREAVADRQPVSAEFRLRGPDGSWRWTNVRSAPIRDETGRICKWVGMNIDVSERVQAEEGLRKAEKLSAAGRMAAAVAHEINNPLAAVVNILYLLRNEPISDTARNYLDQAMSELERVIRITRQTLAFYRETGRPSHFDLGDIAQEVITFLEPVAKKQGTELKLLRRGGYSIHGFPGEIRQVLANLVTNALQAGARSVRVHVYCTKDWTRDGPPGVRVNVIDDGTGIPKEQAKKVFEPFYTTKGSTGTGLGLWVARSIVAKHEGRIRVRSRIEKNRSGTCVCIFLPSAANESLLSTPPVRSAA